MKSYASICSFDGNFARLEVEMHAIFDEKLENEKEHETRVFDVSLDVFPADDEEFYEGDIVVVEHDMEYVTKILYKDEVEKIKRTERISSLKKLLEAKM